MPPNTQNIDDIVRAILSDARFQDSIVKIVRDIVASGIQKAEKTIESQPVHPTATATAATTKTASTVKAPAHDWSRASQPSLFQAFYRRRNKGAPIEDDLNRAMAATFPTYDPVARNFSAEPRKKSIRDCADGTLRNKYYEAYASGNITPELNQVLAERFPDYNPTTQKFTTPRGRHKKPAEQPK